MTAPEGHADAAALESAPVEGASNQASPRSQAERDQLHMHFTQMIGAHGIEGTAQELGLSGRTVRRARDGAKMTPAVEDALARHVARTLTVRDTPWRQPLGALDHRLGLLEQAVKDIREQLAAQDEARERREQEAAANQRAMLQRVERLERSIADVRQLMVTRTAQQDTKPSQSSDVPAPGNGSQPKTSARQEGQALSPEVQHLLDARNAAKSEGERSAKKIERLTATAQRLEAELRLIRDYGQSWPPGQMWTRSKQTEEIGWRQDALEANRREHDRLIRRRRLRRILTLGLWW